MQGDGLVFLRVDPCVGEHGKHYTTRTIFLRWRRLIQKRRRYGQHVARGVPGAAFLLERPRTRDVYAVSDGARILSLSEGQLRKMIKAEPDIAAQLLLNISKMLCYRVLQGR